MLISIAKYTPSHGKAWAKKSKLNPKMVRRLQDIRDFYYPPKHILQDHLMDLVADYVQENLRRGQIQEAANAIRLCDLKIFGYIPEGDDQKVIYDWDLENQTRKRAPLDWQEAGTKIRKMRIALTHWPHIPHKKDKDWRKPGK